MIMPDIRTNRKAKKIRRFLSLFILLGVLFSQLAALPAAGSPVLDYAAGGVSSFELLDENTGVNVMGTILNKSSAKDVASYYDPNICTRLSFANVRIFINGGITVDWSGNGYYWRARSLNSEAAQVTGERMTDGDKDYYTDDVYNEDYFLRIDVFSPGTTVIDVEVSASPDMTGSIARTFTVRVIDDSRDGETRASFRRGASDFALDLDGEVRINMTETAELLIASVTAYDYSDLSAGNANFERTLTDYSWTAEVINKTGAALVSSSSDGIYLSETAASVSEDNPGNKILYIRPLKEGTADIEFAVIHGEYGGEYNAPVRTVQTIRLFISRVVGNPEFKPVSRLYGQDSRPEEVRIELEDFYVLVNGEKRTAEQLVNSGDAVFTAYITVPKNKMDPSVQIGEIGETTETTGIIETEEENQDENGEDNADNEDNGDLILWESNPANMTEAVQVIEMDGDFLRNPFIYTPLTDGARVKIDINGQAYNEYKSAVRYIDIKFVTEDDDGKLASLNFIGDGKEIYDGTIIEAGVDRYGNAERAVVLDGFEAEVYDPAGVSSGYKRRLDSYLYVLKAETDRPDIIKLEAEPGGVITALPLKAGSAEIKITADAYDGRSSFEVAFHINSSNIGLFPEDEGIVKSIELKRNGENQKIYTGENQIVYIKSGDPNALTVNIDRVTAAANDPGSEYTEELKNYRWDISQAYGSLLEFERTWGISDTDGKADIKIGAPKIENTESERIAVTLRVTPYAASYDEEGRETRRYDRDKSLAVSFNIIINELGGKFELEIDYQEERIYIVTSRAGEDKGYYNFNGSPEYMYSLKSGADNSREEWFPFMGNSMDISSLIPKGGTSPFAVSVREIGAEPESDGNYSADNRKIAELYPRRPVTAAERRAIVYRDEKIIYEGLESGTEYIFYKIGSGDFERGEINANSGISAPVTANPTGNTVTVKFAAYLDYANEENNRFASAEFNIKIPAAGRMPVIKDDRRRKYSGFTDRMMWSASITPESEGGVWENCAKGAVRYENLKLAFPGLEKDEEEDFYNLYVKTAAASRTPESNILNLKIPAAKYER
ncbi:MAG: hypothetical protein FWH10_07005 [Oscillospiraceae bacterium]|nr:hypothetical protein [Oscillospiraceae bacterium]